MIPNNKYIIFNVPSTQRDLIRARYPVPHHKIRFCCGNYNKRLVSDILSYNGIQAATSDKDRKTTIYWGTCLEVSNQQISQYGNSNTGYNSHNFNPILSGPVNNYAGNLDNVNILFKYNHFPNSKLFLGNKAEFAYIIQKNPAYDSFPRFLPFTYILPRDRDSLFKAMRSHPSTCYISKPPSSSCGNGIKLVTYSDFYYISPNSVVSEYINRPLCIDGFKFDLRVYVLVTSFCPLRAFVAKEGLARFATESYSSSSANIYSHLTNATLNKKSRHWENGAFKWKLSELVQEVAYRYSQEEGDEVADNKSSGSRERIKSAQGRLMDKILETVAVTLAFVQPSMCPRERRRLLDPCFELFGFDLIFDRNLHPYILEVNTMPSLNTDEDVDYEVKAPLLAQAFSIVGVPDLSREQMHEAVKEFKLPKGGVAAFDAEIVRQEDERNRLSGNGFIRIFPTEKYGSRFNHILHTPKLHQRLQNANQAEDEVNNNNNNNEENAEAAVEVKTKEVQINHSQSKTLPSLAQFSSSSKPGTASASRIKVTTSAANNNNNNSAANRGRTMHAARSKETIVNNNNVQLSPEVGAAVLAIYLSKVDMRLRATGDPRLAARAQCFLVAQGYRVARGVAGIRALLQHYIGQVRTWSVAPSAEKKGARGTIPEKMKNELVTGDDEAFKRILTSCEMPMVKNIRLLFK